MVEPLLSGIVLGLIFVLCRGYFLLLISNTSAAINWVSTSKSANFASRGGEDGLTNTLDLNRRYWRTRPDKIGP